MGYGENFAQPPYFRAAKSGTRSPTVIDRDDREEVFRVLMLTPIGREAREAYDRLEGKRKMKLQFVIEDKDTAGFWQNGKGPLAGCTDDDPAGAHFPKKLRVNIMAIQTSKGYERMKGWSREERIHIITVHERHHVRTNGSLIESPENIKDEPERSIVAKELQARFEYSIQYPDSSCKRDGWLANYVKYFAPKNRRNEDPVLEAYFAAVVALYDAGTLSSENYEKAKKLKDYNFLVK